MGHDHSPGPGTGRVTGRGTRRGTRRGAPRTGAGCGWCSRSPTAVVVEQVGALLSGSLALLADAGHMFTDTAATLAERVVGAVLDDLGHCVSTHFGIDHTTFQVEPASHRDHEPGGVHD